MLQNDSEVGWDPLLVVPHTSLIARFYVLFLVVAVIATMAKLVPLWIAAPPFRLSGQRNNPDYLQRLQRTRTSIQQWLVCTLLGWGFVASSDLFAISRRLLEPMLRGTNLISFAVTSLSISLEMALFVALLLFVAQWHLLNRIERLRQLARLNK